MLSVLIRTTISSRILQRADAPVARPAASIHRTTAVRIAERAIVGHLADADADGLADEPIKEHR